MTPAAWGALGIAVFGAISYAAGSILQAIGARRSTGTVRTLGHPIYLLGVACDILSWAGSMVALRELAVYQVQSVLAGSLAITVVMARVFLGSRVRRRDAFAVVITVAALAVLAMSAGPQQPVAASTGLRIGFCAAAGATVVLGWIAAKFTPPGVVAGLSGLAFGGAALAGRALSLPDHPTQHLSATAAAIFTEPLTAALVTFAAAGMLLYTHALQHGQVGPVTAVLWIGEVVAPSAVGLMLLGDTVLPGWDLRAAVAGFIVVASAVILATAPATSDTAQPAPAPAVAPAVGPAPALAGASTTVYPFLAGVARAHSASAGSPRGFEPYPAGAGYAYPAGAGYAYPAVAAYAGSYAQPAAAAYALPAAASSAPPAGAAYAYPADGSYAHPAAGDTLYPATAGYDRPPVLYAPDGRPLSAPPRSDGRPLGPPLGPPLGSPPARVAATYPVWPPPAYHEPTPAPGRRPTGNTVWWGPPSAQQPIYIPPGRPSRPEAARPQPTPEPIPEPTTGYATGPRYEPAPPHTYEPAPQPVSHWPLTPQAFLPQPTREQPGWA